MSYLIAIILCYLSMIIFIELFSQKPMSAWHAIIPSSIALFIIILDAKFNINSLFSPWLYPSWFFRLLGYFRTYLFLIIPILFGAVYIDDRRKACSAFIVPATIGIYILIRYNSILFSGFGKLALYIILLYLAWGLFNVFAPRFILSFYIKLRDKLGGRRLFNIISGIIITTFIIAFLVIVFTVIANYGKMETDYIKPPLTTTDIESTF